MGAPVAPTAVAAPVVTAPPAQDASVASNNMLPIAGAVGLGLFALIVVGLAMRRRRRRNEEEVAAADQDELAVEAPVQPDPLFAEPAFAATAAPAATSAPAEFLPAGAESAPAEFLPAGAESAPAPSPSACDDAAPGSHVEAACEGPSEDNPSLSIKKRLKRAQFFDQREQMVAAGLAVPVASDAGLPDAVETAASPATEPSGRPTPRRTDA